MQINSLIANQENTAPLTNSEQKYVIKRDGTKQIINQDKIRQRLSNLSDGLNTKYINFDVIVNKVYQGIYSGTFPSSPLTSSLSPLHQF